MPARKSIVRPPPADSSPSLRRGTATRTKPTPPTAGPAPPACAVSTPPRHSFPEPEALPELLRLIPLEARISRMGVVALERLAALDGETVSTVLARELRDLVSVHSD
jgi:hypothetical protein